MGANGACSRLFCAAKRSGAFPPNMPAGLRCAMRFQKSQPAGAATIMPPSVSTGPLKNMDVPLPARKAHAQEMHEKAGSISSTCELPWPVWGAVKKRSSTKPV